MNQTEREKVRTIGSQVLEGVVAFWRFLIQIESWMRISVPEDTIYFWVNSGSAIGEKDERVVVEDNRSEGVFPGFRKTMSLKLNFNFYDSKNFKT